MASVTLPARTSMRRAEVPGALRARARAHRGRSLAARAADAFAVELRRLHVALADPLSEVLVAVFLGMQLLDLVTTRVALQGGSVEVNPVTALVLSAGWSVLKLAGWKALISATVILTASLAEGRTRQLLGLAALVTFLAVLWNLLVLS